MEACPVPFIIVHVTVWFVTFDGVIAALSCREIFELSYTNSPVAIKVVKENAEMVGIGLANLITIFAPEIIVLGEGMSEANDSYLL
jgi:glucokinase